ncbi:MAG: ABC transporter substrate-binding protein, partial [Pseudolysinimonas sp.]
MARHSFHRSAAALLAGAAAVAVVLTGCQAGGGDAGDGDSGSGYVTDGKITIGTGEPAYYPWVIDDAPESGEGFEAAIACAVAEQLGFDKEDVVWVRTTFDEAIAPGPKDFDFNLQQFSITEERAAAVDFSSPYYETTQVVITTEASAAAGATSIADLKGYLIGAQVGTTSFDAIEQQIAPDAGAQVYNTNDDAKLALESGQVDAIVVDLPT